MFTETLRDLHRKRARVDARFILIEISAALESAIRCIPQSVLVQSSFIKRGLELGEMGHLYGYCDWFWLYYST
jgi:hypothetical protein